jgi:hypothetical protein
LQPNDPNSGSQKPETGAKVDPNPFPYVLYWNKLGRKGQRCSIVVANSQTCRVRFEDNFEAVLNRQAIRQGDKSG